MESRAEWRRIDIVILLAGVTRMLRNVSSRDASYLFERLSMCVVVSRVSSVSRAIRARTTETHVTF